MKSYKSWPESLNESFAIDGTSEQNKSSTSLLSRRCLSLSSIGFGICDIQEKNFQLYKELNRKKKEIRLLVVEPGFEGTVVKAKFKQAFLTDDPKPQYETISYTWGDATQRSTVILHGKSTNVPASAKTVLRRMRYPDRPRVLWIDAVCINQDDDLERGHQVGIMADIYGGTWRNLVWLGEDDQCTATALDSIEELNEEFRRETGNLSNVHDTLYTSTGLYKYSSKQVLAKIDPEALTCFYTRPWFSRLWVVQEAALAAKSDCFCGRHEIALERVFRAARWLEYKLTSAHGVPRLTFERCASVFDYTDRDYGPFGGSFRSSRPRMVDLLFDLRNFNATEPRDHIFALLGLWQKYRQNEILPASLKPDYVSPLSDVLRRATQFVLQELRSLEILRFARHRIDEIEIPRLPTWVPRWHQAFDPDADAYSSWFYTEWPKGHDVLMNFAEEGSLLVNGAILDDVQQVQPRFAPWNSPPEMLRHSREIESVLSHDLHMSASSHNEILSEFARMGEPSLRNQETNLYLDWTTLLKVTGEWCRPGTNCPRTKDFENLFSFESGLFSVSYKRLFFMTSSNHFGFGPQTMREGDILTVLDGLNVLAILRPLGAHSGGYEYVGDAAVYGLMKGEAIHQMKAEGRGWDCIRLR